MATSSVILFNKPYGVQSQFSDDANNKFKPLAEFFDDKSLRVAGRLDATSEGLLLLTSNGQVNKAITHPPKANAGRKQGKTYLVQVEGVPTAEQLTALRKGVVLKDGKTLPAEVAHVSEDELPMPLWQRDPPIRERKSVPDSWLMMTIYEGKNRQVRRMTAHVGLPCLRLIRWSVAGFELGNLGVGEFVSVHLNAKRLQQLGVVN
ncbi:pseudouridine synthase [Psychrobacter sp. FDAARGOS_221]|uniref:pseudouridine synthase n=1 Tax=Psychrobacter sp. FDAARGOS_221 TaxID=1975705 RepID=UPI000BB52F34|nr:pseudouridine synthase [Psychrobacter sp. FDAARGOS_221]PNK61070.1 pseudouridine synthase [Psychrobacter sp. FDAARGOS_221]